MDRRLTFATDRVAHLSLKGLRTHTAFVAGQKMQVAVPLADLLASPAGARDRQLWLGDDFLMIDSAGLHGFGRAEKDGYCGWLALAALGPPQTLTHYVAAPASHLYPEPRSPSREIAALPMGARLRVLGWHGKFAETGLGFVPAVHLRPMGQWAIDPVSVAESLLGTPYLWGGNSRAGIDCSGLVQAAHLACGMTCPADSDLQQVLGREIPDGVALQRGDLLFWQGHVALVVDGERLIHANGHSMSVAYEDTAACIARIAAQSGGPVTLRKRP